MAVPPAQLGAPEPVRLQTDPSRLPDDPIRPERGPASRALRTLGPTTFRQAAAWIRSLPYGRSPSGRDPRWVTVEGRRTCSSGSGLLVHLAREQGVDARPVWLVHRLDGETEPAAAPALAEHGVQSVLEVHTVVAVGSVLFDVIRAHAGELEVLARARPDLEDLGDAKVRWHRDLMTAAGEADRWPAREAAIRSLGAEAEPGVHSVEPTAVLPLRRQVLRPHQTAEASAYGEDPLPTTHHLAHRDRSGAVRAVGTSLVQARPGGPARARRLRGMAVHPDRRGTGLGRRILDGLVAWAAWEGAEEVWCNARESALGFYARAGFETVGDRFELPDIGPHFVMRRGLP